MKTTATLFLLFSLMSGTIFGQNKDINKSVDTIYFCPMHQDIKSLQPGTCSKCGMDLIPTIYEKKTTTDSSTEEYYTCSMHPEIHSELPGDCPKCGMKLVKNSQATSSNHGMMGMMGMMMNSPWMIGMGIIMIVVMTLHFVK